MGFINLESFRGRTGQSNDLLSIQEQEWTSSFRCRELWSQKRLNIVEPSITDEVTVVQGKRCSDVTAPGLECKTSFHPLLPPSGL